MHFPTRLKVLAARGRLDSLLQLLFVSGRQQAANIPKPPIGPQPGPGSRRGPEAHWLPPLNEAGHSRRTGAPRGRGEPRGGPRKAAEDGSARDRHGNRAQASSVRFHFYSKTLKGSPAGVPAGQGAPGASA
jgi:hypothetical protein